MKGLRGATGFTLVEVMIVVAIIALLAAIAVPNLMTARRAANDAAAVSTLRSLSTAIETYAAAEAAYPNTLSDLVSADYLASGAVPDDGSSQFAHTFNYQMSSNTGYTLEAIATTPLATKSYTIVTGGGLDDGS